MRNIFAITPFIIIAFGIICYIFYIFIHFLFIENWDEDGWGILLIAILIIGCFFVLVIDLVTKFFIKSYKNLIIFQVAIIVIIGLYRLSTEVKQTILLPEEFDQTYVTIIFEVEGEPKLPYRLNPFQEPIRSNQDGYILTSSSPQSYNYGYGLNNYVLKIAKKEVIGSEASPYDFTTFHIYKIKYEGNSYPYLTFKIDPKEDCCGWSVKDINKHEQEVYAYITTHID